MLRRFQLISFIKSTSRHHISLSYLIYYISKTLNDVWWWARRWFRIICDGSVVAVFWYQTKRAVIFLERFENSDYAALILILWCCAVIKILQRLQSILIFFDFNMVLDMSQSNKRTFQEALWTILAIARKLFQYFQSLPQAFNHFIGIRDDNNELSRPETLIQQKVA